MIDNTETYIPLHQHSFFSLLDGLSSPKDIVDRCVELGLPACGITDHGNIAAMKAFYDECKKAKIKCILGVELYICEGNPTIKNNDNNKRYHLIVLAKNDQGVGDLMALVSETNKPEHFYRKPRIDLKGIARFAKRGNLIFLSACIAGALPASLFSDFKEAIMAGRNGNAAGSREYLKPNWKEIGRAIIAEHVAIFGKDNYYLEIQISGMGIQIVVAECLRELSKETGIPVVPTTDSHYCRKEDAEDQRLLLYASLHTTKEAQDYKISTGQDVMDFFVSDTKKGVKNLPKLNFKPQ